MISNESYLAGALLIDGPSVVTAVQGIVCREDFKVEGYGAIFSAAVSLAAENAAIDPVAIQQRAAENGFVLSAELLAELMETTPTAAHCVEYAHRVAEDSRRRKIQAVAEQICGDELSSADELAAALQQGLAQVQGSGFQKGLLTPAETLRRFSDHAVQAGAGRRNFVPSGFPRLDQVLGGGFIRGGLYIVGARPAVGKSTFALNLADRISGNCLFTSLEMSPEQLMAKRVSRLTGISAAKLLGGQLSDPEWQAVARAGSALGDRGVYMNARYDLSTTKIQLLAQQVPELRAVIIDYLGLIQPATRGGSAYEAVTQLSRELKRMAISLDVPVICLCQLSRQVENREDKRPRLSDLRDSGAIEQDADGVLFLYRPDYYNGAPEEGQPSLVCLDVAKNRHGRTGTSEFNFWLEASSFSELE